MFLKTFANKTASMKLFVWLYFGLKNTTSKVPNIENTCKLNALTKCVTQCLGLNVFTFKQWFETHGIPGQPGRCVSPRRVGTSLRTLTGNDDLISLLYVTFRNQFHHRNCNKLLSITMNRRSPFILLTGCSSAV